MNRPPLEIAFRNELLQEVRRFLQSAVHDLRANQRRMGVSAELLIQAASDSERAALAAQIALSLSKSEELLTAIGKYANALAPGSYSIAPFPCAVAVRLAQANLEGDIRATNASVTVDDLPEIAGDRDRITELFEHLISNAIKFRGPEPPAIHISARQAPDGWVFSVRDYGVGIPAKYHDRMFVAFYRLHGPDVPGTGLGLATCKNIVEAHGGKIWIDPNDEPGVTFSFRLMPLDGD